MRSTLAALLAALLAGCQSLQDAREIEANIVRPGNFRAGPGVIESVAPIAESSGLWRLYLRMDNTGFQAVDVDDGRFFPGEVVELTNDGRVVRATGTSLKNVIRRN